MTAYLLKDGNLHIDLTVKEQNKANHEKSKRLTWLYLVLCSSNNSASQVNKINDELNYSDHLMLSVTLQVKHIPIRVEKQTHKLIKRFKWPD